MKYCLFLILFIYQQKITAQINQTDLKGRKQGIWEKKYPNSNFFQYKGQFKDNIPIGTFTYYYPEGQVKAVIDHFKDGHRSLVQFFFENKVIMCDGFYYDQKKDSTWVNYNLDGLVLSVENYKNDKLNGKKIMYYLEGQIETEKLNPLSITYYEDGIINGEYKEYFSTGKLKRVGLYIDGEQQGEWKEYYPNGSISSSSKYKNGLLHGWSYSYNKQGEEIGKEMYQFGELLSDKQLSKYLKTCEEKGIDPNQ